MQMLLLAVLLGVLRLTRSDTTECKTYDYLRMLFAKFDRSTLQDTVFSLNFTDASNTKFQVRLKICRSEAPEPKKGSLIECTNHTETNREIALAVFRFSEPGGTPVCQSAYFTFENEFTISLKGSRSDNYNGSRLVYYSEKYKKTAIVNLDTSKNETSGLQAYFRRDYHYFIEGRHLAVDELTLTLNASWTKLRIYNSNIFNDGFRDLKRSIFKAAMWLAFFYCNFLNTQDTTVWYGIKPFKFYMVWFTTFRLITWVYILLWEKIDDLQLDSYLPLFYLFQACICLPLLRLRDPIHLYKKMVPLYNLFSFVDYMFMMVYLSWWTGVLGMMWYLVLFYWMPNYTRSIGEVSEWKLSVSAAIEILCYHGMSFWPVKKIGVVYVLLEDLRPLFVSDSLLLYAGLASTLVLPIAALRYSLARRFNSIMIRRVTGELNRQNPQKPLNESPVNDEASEQVTSICCE